MTTLKVIPKKLKGTVTVPPSKSMAHRAVICASLADGRSVISNIQLSDDIKATIEGMRAFGAVILHDGDTLTIDGIGTGITRRSQEINCNESGSTLRFLVPLATLFEGETRFVGKGKLGQRPLEPYQEMFENQSLRYEPAPTELLDLTIEGRLKPGVYEMAGDISSQFITGMLLTLPMLDGESVIKMTTHLESKGYIDLTLTVLKEFGIEINHDKEYKFFKIKGNQSYQAQDYKIEGDYSQAAFWLSARTLANEISVEGLNDYSLQGDREIVEILEDLSQQADERVIDGAQVPDIIPVVALVAALSKGKTRLINLDRLRIKESDRLIATQKELAALGARIKVVGADLHIEGVSILKGGQEVWSHKDHRMAMMLAIASTICQEPIIIKDTECVKKSYPDFWEVFQNVGGEIHEWNMG
ncbi:3-phosphoshikimate 1-carboxyvinyltransferase [Marinilactibacillus sp. 15R]|uniref:3-phosphoshikimate 1-carboxyvinyltransferase n=1 Tax=Marinilactibacillus piezotolerans TaxID=258723 RepID=A0A1I3XGD4_9LACT|nr:MULTISPECIES: 3-phosphoshikimate 1-carboxyvinyltransferase [Marinilactibacillus]API88219.1 3-phosphoshikimate 1-carboxyvinyltransferase [Marinilactibacillus sp. 15R]SFK18575.1 3-phosphoshikimate 1-carboxyvinyltransferase [Marinilactibacillus piezotolerans]